MQKWFLVLGLLLCLTSGLQAATISGFITEAENGEPVPHAVVMLKDTQLGAYSNSKGYFVINQVPKGETTILVQHISFQLYEMQKNITVSSENVFMQIELEKNVLQMEGISVKDTRIERKVNTRKIRGGDIVQSTHELKMVSQIAEADVFRAVQALPGVASINDFSAGLYVRGGSPDQNLILLDGIDVYNPNHFGGVFSTFNTDAVRDIELLKGGFPSLYGGRLSAVLNVTNKEGNRKQFQGIGRVSLLSSSLTVEGPWKVGKRSGSWMLSGRRTYIDVAAKAAKIDDFPDYYFYDGHARFNLDATKTDKLSLSLYTGKDEMEIGSRNKLGVDWGNSTVSAQWTHIFNPQLFSHFILAGSEFNSTLGLHYEGQDHYKRTNEINDLSLKGNLSYKPVEAHLFDFGFDIKHNHINYQEKTYVDLNEDRLPNITVDCQQFSLYAQDSWDLDALWTIQPGIRATLCHTTSKYRSDKPSKDYVRVAPRFSIRRKLTENSNVYFTYGRYYQYLTLLSGGMSSPLDLWFPVDKSVEPGESDHYLLGYKTQVNDNFSWEIETYYKDMRKLLDYSIESGFEWNNETGVLADVFNHGKGHAYGIDCLLRNQWNGFEGFIGYSWGQVKRKTHNINVDPETNEEKYYFPKYDRMHQINLVETYNLTDGIGLRWWGADWRLGLNYAYASGQPYERPEWAYYDGERIKFFYSYKDAHRLPDYSRIDLSLHLKWAFTHWSIEPYLQFLNLFNHKNVWYIDHSAEIGDNGQLQLEEDETGMFPFFPFIGVNIQW